MIRPWPHDNVALLAGLTDEDVRLCPACGEQGTLQENAKRFTWQPLSFAVDPQQGLVESDFGSFDYGDDVEHEDYACRSCEMSWSDLDELAQAFVAARNARADAALLERTVGTKLQNALAAAVCNPQTRLAFELSDPQGLAQAREALGLEPVESLGGLLQKAHEAAIAAVRAHHEGGTT